MHHLESNVCPQQQQQHQQQQQQQQHQQQHTTTCAIIASRIPGQAQVGFLANRTCKDCPCPKNNVDYTEIMQLMQGHVELTCDDTAGCQSIDSESSFLNHQIEDSASQRVIQ